MNSVVSIEYKFSLMPHKSRKARVTMNRVSKFHNNEFTCHRTYHFLPNPRKLILMKLIEIRVFEKKGGYGYYAKAQQH